MFNSIEYLKLGNIKQQKAYYAIENLGILRDLAEYTPTLCGTLPINIDVEGSDLDIIMEVNEFDEFEVKVTMLYSDIKDFRIKRLSIRTVPVIKVNFFYSDFEFELFGQPQPVYRQYAYLHMVIEKALMDEDPLLKQEVIKLKLQGYKTEPAFCKLLGLQGDPYEKLLEYGKEKRIIESKQ